MRILKGIGILIAVVIGLGALGLGIARLVIDGPIAMLAGGELGGTEVAAPTDWGFVDNHQTIAVEVRPADPHSVTVVCMVADNELYIPADRGPEKQWTNMAVADGTARVGIDGKIYPVTLNRVERDGPAWKGALEAARTKYPRLAEQAANLPEDVWLFHAARR